MVILSSSFVSSRAWNLDNAHHSEFHHLVSAGSKAACSLLFLAPKNEVEDGEYIPSQNADMTKACRDYPFVVTFTALSAFAIAISYADRSNLSTAIIPMSTEFQWDTLFSGVVLSVFFAGYASTQIIGGQIADSIGGEILLIVGMLFWSLCTALTPIAASNSNTALIANRVLLGAGEGLALPSIHSMVSRYVPPDQRATSASIVTAACYVGALLSNLVSPPLIAAFDWTASFYTFAVIPPAIWLPLWYNFLKHTRVGASKDSYGIDTGLIGTTVVKRPLSQGSQSSSEQQQQPQQQPQQQQQLPMQQDEERATVLDLLQQRPVWAIIAAQYGQSWGMYGLLSWLPTYYSDRFHIPLQDLGSFTSLPYLTQALVAFGAGFIADYLVEKRKWTVLRVRQVLQCVGMLTPAACLAFCAYAPTLTNTAMSAATSSPPSAVVAIAAAAAASSSSFPFPSSSSSSSFLASPEFAAALITLGSAASALTSGAVSCNQFDISPTNAGTIFGIANTAACIAALVAVPVSGALFDATHSWDAVFLLFSFHYIVGAFIWVNWVSDQPIQFKR